MGEVRLAVLTRLREWAIRSLRTIDISENMEMAMVDGRPANLSLHTLPYMNKTTGNIYYRYRT